MKTFIKKTAVFITTLLAASLFVFGFLQFSQAAAASLLRADQSSLKSAPSTIEADLPGIGYWIVTTNLSDASLSVVNTADDSVYGPFLKGQLGHPGGSLLDIVILPDRTTALVSNFGDSAIHFVDFSNPISPSWIISVPMPMFAEDIDFSQDGRYALVTDGGFSSKIAVIDTVLMTTVYTINMGTKYAQAVEVAPDGTVVVASYWPGELHTLLLSDTGYITVSNSYTNWIPVPGKPLTSYLGNAVNLGLAPDGQTILVCSANTDTIATYQILEPGVLTFTGVVTGLAGGETPYTSPSTQSVAFNEAGDKAYVMVNSVEGSGWKPEFDRLAVLDVITTGQVALGPVGPFTIPRYTSSQFFGVDVVGVAGEKVYMGHPTGSGITGTRDLAVVDLFDFSVFTLTVGAPTATQQERPTGVAVIPVNLEMKKLVGDPAPRPGDFVTYTLVMTANGPQIFGINVEDTLPPEVTLIGPITIEPISAGIPGGPPPVVAHQVVISAHQQVTITIPVQVAAPPDGTIVPNTAFASGPELIKPAIAEVNFVVEWFKNFLPIALR